MLISRTRKKSLKNKFILSVIMLLLTVSCFITVSYAFFTNSAYSKGNKVFAGNLMVDVLISEEDLKANLVKSGVEDVDNTLAALSSFKYERNLTDGTTDSTEVYYYASRIPASVGEEEIDTSILHIDNVEPGQAIRVKVNIVNSGDLALKAAGAIRVEEGKSLTGIETFLVKYPEIAATLNEAIEDQTTPTGKASTTKELYFLNTLLSMQATYLGKPEGANINIDNQYYFKDNGGHLEDVLCVYLLEDVGDGDLNFDRETLNNEDKENKLQDDPRFFGTLKQFEYMITYGDNPTDENISEYNSFFNGTIELNAHGDYKSRLESDYLRYLDYASGYCLPLSEMQDPDNENKIPKDGKNVEVFDADGKSLYTRMGVSEIDTINFLLYMPLEAGDEYQNASISLSLGATASQVEYEKDGTGYMIYDMSNVRNTSHEYTTVIYTVNGKTQSVQIPLLTKGTTIYFDEGEHANYSENPGPILLEKDMSTLDLSDSKYIPTVDSNYTFYGFIYDNKTSTFTSFQSPVEVGDLILIDTKEYRVLDVNYNEVKLLSMFNVANKKFRIDEMTTSFGGTQGLKYEGSVIDLYLEEEYYPSLSSNLKEAIIPQNISQNMYILGADPGDASSWHKEKFTSLDVSGTEYTLKKTGSVLVGPRNVYTLDIDDLIEYLGTSWTPQELNMMFYKKGESTQTQQVESYIWLRSANGYFAVNAMNIDAYNGRVFYSSAECEYCIYPAFVVDLSKLEFSRSEQSEK